MFFMVKSLCFFRAFRAFRVFRGKKGFLCVSVSLWL